jgi:uncharacterized protein
MSDRATIRLLPDDRRLHLNDGPIDLIIGANGRLAEVELAYKAAADRFVSILDELCAELPLLRTHAAAIGDSTPSGAIAKRMIEAVWPYRERCFITPMAAVAGAVAEAVLAVMTEAAQLERAYVNNGGDIAIHVAPGQIYKVGMVERPECLSLFGTVELSAAAKVRGIATSGWRGRSFSLGIADAVTVLAETAAQADAAATVIANAVDLPKHPAIRRMPAREIAPDSDLLDLPVTRAVGPLTLLEITRALEGGVAVAEELRAQELIRAAALSLQGEIRLVQTPLRGWVTKGVSDQVPSVMFRANNRANGFTA